MARGDLAEADGIQSGLNRLASIHAIRPGIAATKAALGVLGLADSAPSAPFRRFDDASTARLREVLASVPEVLA